MEKLICKSLLWKMKLSNGKDYNTTLDKKFLENSRNLPLIKNLVGRKNPTKPKNKNK